MDNKWFRGKHKETLREAADIVMSDIRWKATPQGTEYWYELYRFLKDEYQAEPEQEVCIEIDVADLDKVVQKEQETMSNDDKALAIYERPENISDRQLERLEKAREYIDTTFTWAFTKQGSDYWNQVSKNLDALIEYVKESQKKAKYIFKTFGTCNSMNGRLDEHDVVAEIRHGALYVTSGCREGYPYQEMLNHVVSNSERNTPHNLRIMADILEWYSENK